MEERLEGVGEIASLSMYLGFVSTSVRTNPRQTRVHVWLPDMQHVQLVLTATHLSQVLDAIVGLIAIDMVELHRGKMPMVPNPDSPMVVQVFLFTAMPEIKSPILSAIVMNYTSHHFAISLVYEQSALRVVTIVPLDASGQCSQLAL